VLRLNSESDYITIAASNPPQVFFLLFSLFLKKILWALPPIFLNQDDLRTGYSMQYSMQYSMHHIWYIKAGSTDCNA
jgi:hypothetical protein